MRLNKLIKKFANYTKVDILNIDGSRLFPVDDNSRFKTEHKIQDLKKYKVLQIIAFTQEPGTITVYVEECKKWIINK